MDAPVNIRDFYHVTAAKNGMGPELVWKDDSEEVASLETSMAIMRVEPQLKEHGVVLIRLPKGHREAILDHMPSVWDYLGELEVRQPYVQKACYVNEKQDVIALYRHEQLPAAVTSLDVKEITLAQVAKNAPVPWSDDDHEASFDWYEKQPALSTPEGIVERYFVDIDIRSTTALPRVFPTETCPQWTPKVC